MTDRPSWVPANVDITRPSAARVYDFGLGGSHNFEADREFVRKLFAIMPDGLMIPQENRSFLRRAVQYLCAAGIDQFLDLGSGIPTVGNVHEIAQQANPQARVVYVDHDPVAVAHSQRLLADDDLTAVLSADLCAAGSLLAHRPLRAHLDLSRPVAVLMVAVLHLVPDEKHPAAFIAEYMQAVAPGSYLVISHLSSDGREDAVKTMEFFNRPGSPSPMYLRSREEITALFGGVTMVEPGVVRIPQWRPESPDETTLDAESYPGFAGVGRRD
ncbi:MAG: SAM-dependent methyltransferase [Pseudonocardia sp.]